MIKRFPKVRVLLLHVLNHVKNIITDRNFSQTFTKPTDEEGLKTLHTNPEEKTENILQSPEQRTENITH